MLRDLPFFLKPGFLLFAVVVPLWSAPVTFNARIAPIIQRHCASCHRPGEAGPFSLLTYSDVKRRGAQIGQVTQSRYMPPWLPEALPAPEHFQDEQRLTSTEIGTIQQWVRGGMPEGAPDPKSSPIAFTPGWQLGTPDAIIEAPQPYRLAATGPDVFWNFVLRTPVSATRYVKAIEIRPGNKKLVHHANLLIDRARTARGREALPGAGFAGMDVDLETTAFEPDSHFLFWKPGSSPYVEPDGMAWRIDPQTDLVLNVHLQSSGKPEEVRPSIGIYFTDVPQTRFPMLIQLEHDAALDIPAGKTDFRVSDDFRLPLDIDLLSIYPHAHYLGKRLEGFATLPNGRREELICIPDWDLSWQAVYRYQTPMFLPKGTVVSMQFQYDNSDGNPRNPSHPPRRVEGGNQSTDEMGHLWLQVLPRGPEDRRGILQEALMRHRLEKDPSDYAANFNLGALLLAQQQAGASIPFFQSALRAKPEQATALNGFGAALLASGRTVDAMRQFEHALRVEPGYTNARYNLANAQASEGDQELAVTNFEQVLRENPGDPAATEHLLQMLKDFAGTLASNGRLTDASERLRQALALQDGDAELHNNLGILLARQGNAAAAIGEFQAALRLDPSLAAARRNLELARGMTQRSASPR